jgi:hypothetical protein
MRRPVLSAVTPLLVLAAMPAAAAAADSSSLRADGFEATAAWRSTSPDRCTVGDTFINLATTAEAGSRLWIFQSTIDKCHSAITRRLATPDDGVGLPVAAFQADRFITAATLDAVVPVTDTVTGAAHTLSVHLAWVGRGDLSRSNDGSRFHDASCTIGYHGNGTTRAASASGTVSDGAAEYAGSISPEASLSTVKEGSVEVGCDTPSPAGGFELESPVRGLSADAGFQQKDACTAIYTDVIAYDEADTQSAKAPHTYVLYLDAIKIDTCQDAALAWYRTGFYGSAIPGGSLQIDDRLGTATLDVTAIPVIDLVNNVYATLDVHLAWTATSPPDRYTEGFRSHTPYCNVSDHSRGVARSATAAGTITDGANEFAGRAVGAAIESVQSPDSTVDRSC